MIGDASLEVVGFIHVYSPLLVGDGLCVCVRERKGGKERKERKDMGEGEEGTEEREKEVENRCERERGKEIIIILLISLSYTGKT